MPDFPPHSEEVGRVASEVKPPRAGRGDFERSLIEGVDLASDVLVDISAAIPGIHQREMFASLLGNLDEFARIRDASPQRLYELSDDLVEMLTSDLRHSEVLYVGEEMCELLEWVSDDFKPETIFDHDLLVPFGMAVFAEPQSFISSEGKRVEYEVLTWAFHKEMEDISVAYDDTRGARHGVALNAYMRYQGEWGPCFTGGALLEQSVPEDYEETRTEAFKEVRRTFQVLMRLCAQKLVVDTVMDATRKPRRRAQRAAASKEPGKVRVVTLRKESRPLPEDHVPEPGNWSHRWIVKPHWRNQWYPSLGVHRQILVGPYVKGPETLPLKLPKDRGFALVR